MTYHERWAQAYSYGHNVYKLRGSILVHFANAYADITEGVAYPLGVDPFYIRWVNGEFFGIADPGGEHWVVAA